MQGRSAATKVVDPSEAFYGLSESAFAETLQLLGATDPRLIKAFQNTRDRYQTQRNAEKSP